jgi:hypothetical protein
MRIITPAALAIGSLTLAACGSARPPAPAARPAPAASSVPAAPSPSCARTTTFDYIERDTEPGRQPSALEIGNVNLEDCTPSLLDFQAETGEAQGECTTIALASDKRARARPG